MKDIAKEINVSVTTVSKALNNHPDISDARREEILALIERHNYIPNSLAKSLRTDNSAFIGVIVSDNANPYHSKVIKAMENVASREGFYLLIANTNENVEVEELVIHKMLAINIGGILICPAMGNAKTTEILKKHKIPHVLFNRYIDRSRDSYVVADDALAARVGAEYLLQKYSDRRIVFLAPDLKISTARDRLTGFRQALAEAGRSYDERLLFCGIVDYVDGYAVMDSVLDRFPAEKLCVFCYSDYIAMGVLKRLYELGLLETNDIAVMGIDGVEMFTPFVPSVHIPKYNLGLHSMELLIGKIRKSIEEEHVVMSEDINLTGKLS